MYINMEFLDVEPMENVITCMHYKMDKTVFFGYPEVIKEQKDQLKNFLTRYCGVKQVQFLTLSRKDLSAVKEVILNEVLREKKAGHSIFFDITGGESLMLLAFGMLAQEYALPMHLYDVEQDELILLNEEAAEPISMVAKPLDFVFTIDKFIRMHGGVVNYNMHKDMKDDDDTDFLVLAEKIWKVTQKYKNLWNSFSGILRGVLKTEDFLYVNVAEEEVHAALKKRRDSLKNPAKVMEILRDLEEIGALEQLRYKNGRYSFSYRNTSIKSCLWDAGCPLELHVYQQWKEQAADCMMGVHLDWDGAIDNVSGRDVLNEIDVLALQGNIPTFISCKSGKLDGDDVLHALYELETVARRFGGKYARRVLSVVNAPGATYLERAAELGIEIRVEK